jgi:hypothetical protein
LTDGAGGRPRFARYITDLPDSPNNDVASDLRAHFPVLGESQETAEKTWNSTVARISMSNRYQSLSIAETERQLDELLRLRFPDLSLGAESFRLQDYRRFLRLPSRAQVLNQLSADLMLFGTRANVYRPIVLGYRRSRRALARKNASRYSASISRSARKETGAVMEKIDDYLNWFEATRSQTRRKFCEYLKAAGSRMIRSHAARRSRFIWMCSRRSCNGFHHAQIAPEYGGLLEIPRAISPGPNAFANSLPGTLPIRTGLPPSTMAE